MKAARAPESKPSDPVEGAGVSGRPPGRTEQIPAIGYGLILLWVNFYICRDLMAVQTAPMNSMHGFWMAIARWADGGWW